MKKVLLVLLGLLFAPVPHAFAACALTSLTFKDAAGTTQTLCFGGAAGQFLPAYNIVDSTGANVMSVTAANAAKVDGSAVTQPVSAASLPLPTGAATSANQSTVKAGSTQSVAGDTSTIVQINPNQPNLTTPLNVNMSQLGGSAIVGDPCQVQTYNYTPISITSATTTKIVTGVSAKKIYICSINLSTGAANNVAIMEGTTATTCGTSATGVIGGATAANGLNLAANGGSNLGSGVASIASTATTNDDLCLITSSAGPLAGGIRWVVQ